MSALPPWVVKLAKLSQNFGYLFHHHELLAAHGACAEAYVFTDPNAALSKARQFGEVLAQEMVMRAAIPAPSNDSQYARLQALAAEGVITAPVRDTFDVLRKHGNKALHENYAVHQAALKSLQACFDLGDLFYRAMTGDNRARPFVPPTPPDEAPTAVMTETRELLAQLRSDLADAQLTMRDHATMLDAQRAATAEAQELLARSIADATELRTAAQELGKQFEQLQRQHEATYERHRTEPVRVPAMEREAFVARARRPKPLNEVESRREIDRMLQASGWIVQDFKQLNPAAGLGVAVREFPLAGGRADYVLYVDQRIVGVVEAKREGTTLGDVEVQSARYAAGVAKSHALAMWRPGKPLPFRYESTGVETYVTNALDPHPRSRKVFSFHRPETINRWMRRADDNPDAPTLRARLRAMPALDERGLRPAQIEAVTGLDKSLADDRPRSLIQMATGAGKTYTAATFSYRYLKHAQALRILFLVDRNNLGKQAHLEFNNYVTPDDGRKFQELYPIDRLSGAGMVASSKVVISTIQRLYAALTGGPQPDVDDDNPEYDQYDATDPVSLEYSAALPPETFDLIVIDECHRSIYGRWRAVLDYFDAHLIGLTATPTKQTLGFFRQNVVSWYTYPQAVADGVNVDFDVYRIETEMTAGTSTIEAGTVVPRRDRLTRRERYETLDADFTYEGTELGRDVIGRDQIRLVLQTFKERLFTEIFPGRREVPKTLIYAVNDEHAEEIVRIVREVFGRGNDFAAKITYRSLRDGNKPDDLLQAFRNSPQLRIAVTVDMIATGTDVRPLECVFFMKAVRSATYFEQMKGRGARTLDDTEFQAVTPDAPSKDRFVIVDAVGVTKSPLVDAAPLVRDSKVSLKQLLDKTATLNITPDEVSTLAGRLSRMNTRLSAEDSAELAQVAGGVGLSSIIGGLVRGVDRLDELAEDGPVAAETAREILRDAVRPLTTNPELRTRIAEIRRAQDIVIDDYHTTDKLISAGGVPDRGSADQDVKDWRKYLEDNRDELAAIQVAMEHGWRVTWYDLNDLTKRIARPPYSWTPEKLWRMYEALGKAKRRTKRAGSADLIALIRFELGLDDELKPTYEVIEERFAAWLARQRQAGVEFTDHQLWWLREIVNTIATSLHITPQDLDGMPFTEHGGIDGFLQAFGPEHATKILDDLNKDLTA